MVKKWTIYKIENPNGRIYIGKTCSFTRRMSTYRRMDKSMRNQHILYNSVLKYSFKNHKISKLEEGYFDDIESKEIYWIKSYMSNINKFPKQNGMNLTNGGGGIGGYCHTPEAKLKIKETSTNRKHSDETKKRMSIVQKGRIVSDVTRERLSIAGKKRRFSIEVKEKWSVQRKGRKLSTEAVKRMTQAQIRSKGKSVIQFNSIGIEVSIYPSIGSAARALNTNQSTISKCLLGTQNEYRNFTFKYANYVS